MNTFMIKKLILKDWYFQRWTIAAYLAAGAVALALLATGSDAAFYAGSVLLITVLIALGIHVAMATVVQERTEHTLPFVMSLPVSIGEYTTAKILANLAIFLIPWTALTAGTFAVIAGRPWLPDGLIPFALILLMEIFAGYCLILAVALVSESQAWTVGAMVFGNLFIQGFMYYVSHIPAIAATMKGNRIIWSPPAVALLAGESATILLLLGLTFWLQSRKTDFL
jgi:ABC-2 type transport system permease protein